MSGLEYDLQKLSEIIERLQEEIPGYLIDFSKRKYKPSDLDISARTINNWSDNDLLPIIKKKGWHKFNLTECVWLKIVSHLREFNLPLNAIRAIKDQLFIQIDIPKLLDEHNVLERIKQAAENKNLEELNTIFESEEYKATLDEEEMNLLGYLLIDLIFIRSNYRLLFNTDGEFMVHKDHYEEYLNSFEAYTTFIRSTHISISLNHILYEITNDLIEDNEMDRLKILTKEENQLLEIVREKGVKKVEVTFDRDDQPKLVKVTSESKLDSAKRIKEVILSEGYQDIKITTSKGKVVHCENTRKIKL